jgi:hypothetical protein
MAKSVDRGIQMSTSCSNQLNSSIKKMGGTMTIMTGRWAGRKKKVTSDAKGRWSTMTLTGKQNTSVTIITAYRVCKQKGGEGGTIYHQQQLDFEENDICHVNLRAQFCKDMVKLVRELHSKNHIVILMGDFNDNLNLPSGQVNTMLRDCCLRNTIIDSTRQCGSLPSTYDHGKTCLDMIAITNHPRIPTSIVKAAGFFPHYHFFQTDHRAIYCDIDTSVLFGHFKLDLCILSLSDEEYKFC